MTTAHDRRRETGAAAEAAVAERLAAEGYAIEARNWRCATGELDIVALRDDLIAFVEVRSATTDFLESPANTVLTTKQARVARAADAYLRARGRVPARIRFDVVAVTWREGRANIDYYENAFVPRSAF
jgi:putative endonuclease